MMEPTNNRFIIKKVEKISENILLQHFETTSYKLYGKQVIYLYQFAYDLQIERLLN